MRFSIDVGSELELKLYQAVLLYRNDHGNRYMATVHGVVQQNGDGSPLLGAGQLLSTAACGSWPGSWGPVARWSSCRTRSSRELRTCWHGGRRRRCGQCSSALDRNLKASPANGFRTRPCCSWCAAVFCTFARFLPAEGRGPDTKLAAAPYWNIDSNGAVCAGTMRTPKSLTVTSIAAWQQAFFQSEFTHPGGGGRLTKRRGGTAALWKSLAGKKRFPLSTLIELEPLEQYLKRLETERR